METGGVCAVYKYLKPPYNQVMSGSRKMWSYSTNLEGRVKNFSLPKKRPLTPIYEAVVNSLHSIEERRRKNAGFSSGKISIRIFREPQNQFDANEISPVDGFEIIDNGIGFNDQNMKSFFESDSAYKAEIGGKGVGRFSWLKAFSSVNISSIYFDNGTAYKREFLFSLSNQGVDDALTKTAAPESQTIIKLNTYKNEYKKAVPKQIDTIAMRIMQHCLIYFLDENCPKIEISDDFNNIVLNQLFKERIKTEGNTELFTVEGSEFQLLNVMVDDMSFPGNRLYLCANNRLVKSINLETYIVDLDSQIFERNGFWYVGVLTSKFLDGHVDLNRLSFDIPESENTLFEDITLEKIIRKSCLHVEKYLEEYLATIADEKRMSIEKYATAVAPQFKHLLKYMPDEVSKIKPMLSDDKLDDELYNIKRKFDKKSQQEQQKLLKETDKTSMSPEAYEQYFKQQVKKISEANSAMLAEYIIHRKIIIELLFKGLRRQDDGKFNKERFIHNLIYPVKATSDDVDYETHNLWLIDEKLSYCSFISSDMPFNNDRSQERPDILFLDRPVAVSEAKNNGTIFDTIIVFELKKPMRDDYSDSDNPINQLYSYIEKINSNKAKDRYHRTISVNESTKYYLYAICDITSTLMKYIKVHGFKKTPDSSRQTHERS